ncbi:MAG: membrane dipeptidase [Gemmatimonadaceae bacterium]|nr:membrane dipeptidase [Gemmatimonadaceae bacterium]
MTLSHASRIALALTLSGSALHAQRPGTQRRPAPTSRPVAAQLDSLTDVSPHAMRLWREAVVVDTHNDMPTKVADEKYDPDVRNPIGFGPGFGSTDYPRLLQSGITGQFFSAFVDAPYALMTPDSSFARAMLLTRQVHAFVKRHPDKLFFATSGADLRRAKRQGMVAVFVGVEGGHAIEGSITKLRQLHAAGVRYMTLTWNNGNSWAGAAAGQNNSRTAGLTAQGKAIVREMNRIGVLVDISHVSDTTFWDAVATSTRPVIASHSSSRALSLHRRNLTDDMLRAVAKTGGVVNVNFFSQFIDSMYIQRFAGIEPRLRAEDRRLRDAGTPNEQIRTSVASLRQRLLDSIPETPLPVLVDHIDHIAKVAGVDHVGIGSDFDGVTALPIGMEDVTMLPRIAQHLIDRGYSDTDIKKILGGNMLRVLETAIDPTERKRR